MYTVRTLMILVLASMTTLMVGCSGKVRTAASRDAGIAQEEAGPGKRGNESVVLVYDERMDVYVVSGHDDCFYTAGQFYRKVQGAWEWSVCIEGPWRVIAHRNDLPPGLRKHKA